MFRLGLLLLVGLSFLSCTAKAKTGEKSVGLVVSTLNNPFFVDMKDGSTKKAGDLGLNLAVLDSQNDVAKELANVEDLISRGVSIILINPCDSVASANAVQLALDVGIPVITLDRNIEGANVVSHIASDNMKGGKMAADYIKELVADGQVIEIEGIPGTSAARERGDGFKKRASEIGLNVVANQTANFDRSQGLTVSENLLQVNPDVKAIFAHNDEMALGASKAVEASGKDIKIVGFDAIPDALEAVKAKTLVATIAQQPALIGSLGVENAWKVINKETIPKVIPVELELIK